MKKSKINSNLEKFFAIISLIISKSKGIYGLVKAHKHVNVKNGAVLMIILMLLVSINFASSCNTRFITCDVSYDPDVESLKKVIKK